MVSEARQQKLLAKRKARNRERGARAALIAAKTLSEPSLSGVEGISEYVLDRRKVMAMARKQAREELRTEKRARNVEEIYQAALRQSAFLRLPAEVRCLIYEHVFADKQLSILADSSGCDDQNAKPRTRALRNAMALTAVCRLIRREVMWVLPSLEQLTVIFDGHGRRCRDDFDQWLREMGEERLGTLGALCLIGRNHCWPSCHDDVQATRCTRVLCFDPKDPTETSQLPIVTTLCSRGIPTCDTYRTAMVNERLVGSGITDVKMVEGERLHASTRGLRRRTLNDLYAWVNSIASSRAYQLDYPRHQKD